MQDFVSLFMDFNKEFESPSSFWKWASYALVASTLRTNVYHNAGNEILYPNIYVLILADSAGRKGGPFPLLGELTNELHHTKLYDGRASIQAILEKLSLDVGGKKGIPIRGGSCLLLAEELSAFFVADAQLIPLITNIYRSRKLFDYPLRGNSFVVKDLCVTMLAASNESLLRDIYDSKATYGGLLGRTFLVKADERRPPNSLLYQDVSMPKFDKAPLIASLETISKLSGQIVFKKEAIEVYEDWYKVLYKDLAKGNDPAGVLGRMHTGALKLAMILAASRYTITIEEDIMEEAIIQTTNLKQNYNMYVMGTSKTNQTTIGRIFLPALWEVTKNNGNHMTRKEFLMENWGSISADQLDDFTATLEAGGIIHRLVIDNEQAYSLSDAAKFKFAEKQKGKKLGTTQMP